jgi:hypothetical protein
MEGRAELSDKRQGIAVISGMIRKLISDALSFSEL